jgi:hypothetical protein
MIVYLQLKEQVRRERMASFICVPHVLFDLLFHQIFSVIAFKVSLLAGFVPGSLVHGHAKWLGSLPTTLLSFHVHSYKQKPYVTPRNYDYAQNT